MTYVTGKALADIILSFVRKPWNLPSYVVRPMMELAAWLVRLKGLLLVFLSSTHLLSTHIVPHTPSFEETAVRNMIGVVNQLSIFFFAHPKRQKKVEDAIHSTQPDSKVQKLKDLRWIERIDALDRIKNLYSSIVASFESISAKGSRMWSADTLTDASTLLLAITTTEFVCALVITHECLQYLKGLTISLQEEAKDIVQAVSEIKTLTSTLKEVRKAVDSYRGKWFETISAICSDVGTVPSMPRMSPSAAQGEYASL